LEVAYGELKLRRLDLAPIASASVTVEGGERLDNVVVKLSADGRSSQIDFGKSLTVPAGHKLTINART
jgi:hypothetical protein